MVGTNIYWLGLDENVMYVKSMYHVFTFASAQITSIARILRIQASSECSKLLPMFLSVIGMHVSYGAVFIDLVSFIIMQVMRGSTVRGHTLGISVGNPLSVEPTLDVFNNAAYASIDFAITAARVYGIKVSSPQAFFKPLSDLSLTMISNTKVAHPAH